MWHPSSSLQRHEHTHIFHGLSVWARKGLKRVPAVLSASVSRPITLAGVQQYAAINYSLAALPSIQRAGEQRHSHINTTNGHIKTSSSPLSLSLSLPSPLAHTPIFFSSSSFSVLFPLSLANKSFSFLFPTWALLCSLLMVHTLQKPSRLVLSLDWYTIKPIATFSTTLSWSACCIYRDQYIQRSIHNTWPTSGRLVFEKP